MNHNSKRITKADKGFAWKLDFKDIKVPVKARDIHNIKKNNFIGFSVSGYENNEEHPIYVSKKFDEEKKHGKRRKETLCSYKPFQYFHRRKHFCHYCLQTFSTEEILKCHIKKSFKINCK